jgi:hypothetical protein
VLVNAVVTIKRIKVRRAVFEGWTEENRKIGYFTGVETDSVIGKEIRLYNLQSMLIGGV